MSQQVNLYQPIFRKQKRKFSAMAMLQATALMILGVGLMYGYTYWQVRMLRGDLAQTEKQLTNLTKRLESITRQFGEKLQSKELQARILNVQTQIAEKQRLRNVLARSEFNIQGFADYFIAFARQREPGVWLTGLDISGAAAQLTLKGRSINPELVPRYLQRLSSEQRLNGIEFRTFQMSRGATDPKSPEAPPYVEFMVATHPPIASGAKGAP